MAVYENEYAVYVDLMRQYKETVQHRLEEFRQTIQKDHDLTDGQMNLLWSAAWDAGHSGGLEEVYCYFRTYHDLVTRFATETG
jgi:hypothetical protein